MGGFWTIFGPILTVIIALCTKNVIIALFAGICYLSILINGANFLAPMADYILQGIQGNGFILVLFIPLGVMLYFMRAGGGFKAFEEWAHRKVDSKKQANMLVFLLSLVIGVQDGLANIAIGRIVKPVVDRQKISPYKSAFYTASIAPNIATPFPAGTYFLFCVAMVGSFIPAENAIIFFYKVCGLSFYTWLAILVALLVALEILPDVGAMKKYQQLADEGINVRTGEQGEIKNVMGGEEIKPDMAAFLIPILSLVVTLVIFSLIAGEMVIVPGAFASAILTVVYVMLKGSVKPKDVGDGVVAGALEQAPLILMLTFAFVFGYMLQLVGFSDYIVKVFSGTMPGGIVPIVCFAASVGVAYTTGSLGSALVIMLPIALPLAGATGASLLLTFAATYSGSQWGDQTSPISDVLIENAGANEVDPVILSQCMLPYRLAVLGICAVLFTILGFVL